MLDRIIKYIDWGENNKAGQRSDGTYYIKDFTFKNEVDLREKICKYNQVLNDVNDKIKKNKKEKKEIKK